MSCSFLVNIIILRDVEHVWTICHWPSPPMTTHGDHGFTNARLCWGFSACYLWQRTARNCWIATSTTFGPLFWRRLVGDAIFSKILGWWALVCCMIYVYKHTHTYIFVYLYIHIERGNYIHTHLIDATKHFLGRSSHMVLFWLIASQTCMKKDAWTGVACSKLIKIRHWTSDGY